MRQLTLDVRPEVVPTLRNYVVGPNAALIAALLRQAAATDGSVLYFWGEAGSGRTHLLSGVIAECLAAHRPATYLSAWDSHHADIPPGGLLAIDDVDRMDADGQASLFRCLIANREAKGSIVLAGNAPPQQLRLREDVRTRIGQGLIYSIQPLADTDKGELLRQNASARGMILDDGIIDYLLHHGRRDLPWLMMVLDALDEVSLIERRRVTLPLLRELLRESSEPELPFHPETP